MSDPNGFENRTRSAIIIALAVLVVIAPLIGVYAFSPLVFVSGVDPYQLAVALSVMLAEALAIAALAFLVLRSKR